MLRLVPLPTPAETPSDHTTLDRAQLLLDEQLIATKAAVRAAGCPAAHIDDVHYVGSQWLCVVHRRGLHSGPVDTMRGATLADLVAAMRSYPECLVIDGTAPGGEAA